MAKRTGAMAASIPAPVGGWNAIDSIASMPASDAVDLVNWFPATTEVSVRGGYINWSTGLGASSQVETLAAYTSGTTAKLFAWAGTSVFDCTSTGAVGAAVVSTLTNARWQYINVTNTAGTAFLLAVNGVDNLLNYNGTAWEKVTGVSAQAITGVATTALSSIAVFKHRVWLAEKDTLNLWYLQTDAIAGAATKFPLAGLCSLGGSIAAIGSWTLDAGSGVDDHFVIITSVGEVLVYKGTDPAAAATWAIVGIWQIGKPIGSSCMMKFAGDIIIITQDGLVPLSGALQSSRVNPRVALTNKIQRAVSSAISSYQATYGWGMVYHPDKNMLILNVPVTIGQQEQYAMNTITKSWCRFTGMAANCWVMFEDKPYFGGLGVVCQADSGHQDNGSLISASASQAYNYFGARGAQKRFTMIRPLITASAPPSINVGMDVDFSASVLAPLSAGGISASSWDVGLWDSAAWGGDGGSVYKAWQGLRGIGYCGSIRLDAAINGSALSWSGTDVVMERGGIL